MKKLPDELSLVEIARLLCGKKSSKKETADCNDIMLSFLIRAVTPFNPKRISAKHHLVVFFKDEPKGYWDRLKRSKNHGANAVNADRIIVGREYFMHFISRTPPSRYPRIKEHYRKSPFWGLPEKPA